VDWAYQVDPLSSVMLLVVTFVGFFIHVYSIGYMGHDPGYARFMSYLNLFMFAMLTLVLGANYLVLFVGWEGVGLCSYLLIGFWFEKHSATSAGMKAFIVNRIGDAGFALGMFLIYTTFGSLDFRTVMAHAAEMPVEWAWGGTLTVIALSLFVGATGKSAQLPLYVWLPDAMEGPTPVSALIHAATMVTGGRLHGRALVRDLRARPEGDVRGRAHRRPHRVLRRVHRPRPERHQARAGLLDGEPARLHVPGLRRGGVRGGRVPPHDPRLLQGPPLPRLRLRHPRHVGRAGHAEHGRPPEQAALDASHDARGCIAIAGVPPLAGFFSKDEILWSAYKISGYGTYVWAMGLAVAAMTAFYMFRLYHMTFSGTFRGTEEQAHHVHESPRTMILPLQVLAVGSILAGLLGVPPLLGDVFHIPNLYEHFTEPVFEAARETLPKVFTAAPPAHSIEMALMAASVTIAAFGIALAWQLFRRHPEVPHRHCLVHRAPLPAAPEQVLRGRDLRRAVRARARPRRRQDALRVDPLRRWTAGTARCGSGLGVNGLGWFVREVLAKGSDVWDRYVVDGLVNLTAAVFDNMSYVFRSLQNGLVQHYALSMLIIVLFMIGIGSRFIL
jgi:NADH-quinone oxidoreductase subunit L